MFSPLKAFATALALLATLMSAAIGGLAAHALAWYFQTKGYRYVSALGSMESRLRYPSAEGVWPNAAVISGL